MTFIGVLEHIENLSEVLCALRKNNNIRYVFFSVPMMSLSCVVEAAFPNVFNRHLGGGHTHLFSKESLAWMYSNYGFTPVANWDFGADVMDIYRSLAVTLTKQNANKELINCLHTFFRENADILQMTIDKASFSSETHVLITL